MVQGKGAPASRPVYEKRMGVGRIVQYVLSDEDVAAINARRTGMLRTAQTGGTSAYVGNAHQPGDVCPLLVVRVWPDEFGAGKPGVNGQVFLDGNDSHWITSAKEGDEHGTWRWPR